MRFCLTCYRQGAASLQSDRADNDGFVLAVGTLSLWGFDLPLPDIRITETKCALPRHPRHVQLRCPVSYIAYHTKYR